MPRRIIATNTRVAGEGSDGELYGVTTIEAKGEGRAVYRREPCPTCPWRLDAEVGRFPAQAYRESAPTAYDAATSMFSCHESGKEKPATCAGFLLANSANNLGVRIAAALKGLDFSQVRSEVALYGSYREMAIANGVAPDDPTIQPCRADNE